MKKEKLPKRAVSLLLMLIVAIAFAVPGFCADSGQQPIGELEEELSLIENELNMLEKKVDNLMKDLVDPKITSFSLYFSSKSADVGIPLSLEVRLNNLPLVTRELSETDRLVLFRGGAIEVYSGVTEPMEHTIDLRCFIQDKTGRSDEVGSANAVFKFEPHRASANFIEITLSKGQDRKTEPYSLTAKHWSKEP
ncbi:hypothetical protein EP232_02290 [bacterium]|nr:MAG: hypothetical protein EP232_02290 [bacterium]